MRNTSASIGATRGAYVPTRFHDVVDVADCAVDEQLEQLQRQYAAARRAAARAQFEHELLEGRDDMHPHILSNAKRQRDAAETRCLRLVRAIDALEDRLENA